MRTRLLALAVSLLLTLAAPHAQQPQVLGVISAFPLEAYLEPLRPQAGIPGMSAALVQDGQIIWEHGFGFRNVEARIGADPDTPYLVGDLGETLTSVLVLQCAEQRLLDLDAPVGRYGILLPESTASLRNLLSHTSAGAPGQAFTFDPARYSLLSSAVEACSALPYRKTLSDRLLERLAMIDSVPGTDLQDPNVVPADLYDPALLARYAQVLQRLAVPYKVERRNHVERTDLPVAGINASNGLVTTVRDLAKFDAALDSGLLVQPETLAAAWTNVMAADGTPLPTGLGWFVQSYNGLPVVWHFGLVPNAYSSLMIKLPTKHTTLILLANSDGLTAPFQIATGDVTRSLFATLFLRLAS